MDLSDKMPASQDSTLAARMPSTMQSDAPAYPGEGGSDDSPVVPILRDSPQNDPEWHNLNEQGQAWQTEDKKLSASDGWSMDDRANGTEGGVPQRDGDDTGTEGPTGVDDDNDD